MVHPSRRRNKTISGTSSSWVCSKPTFGAEHLACSSRPTLFSQNRLRMIYERRCRDHSRHPLRLKPNVVGVRTGGDPGMCTKPSLSKTVLVYKGRLMNNAVNSFGITTTFISLAGLLLLFVLSLTFLRKCRRAVFSTFALVHRMCGRWLDNSHLDHRFHRVYIRCARFGLQNTPSSMLKLSNGSSSVFKVLINVRPTEERMR